MPAVRRRLSEGDVIVVSMQKETGAALYYISAGDFGFLREQMIAANLKSDNPAKP